jgi:ankyrin repeat protein
MAYSPIKDKEAFISEQESRARERRQEEKDNYEKYESERIENMLKQKERAQCDEYLTKLRAHPDWYYWQDKIKLVESLEKGAIVEEQLYPGKRHQRNAERMRREEAERRQLEEVRIKTDIKIPERYKKLSNIRDPYKIPEGPDLNESRDGQNDIAEKVKFDLSKRNMSTYGSAKAREERLNGRIKDEIHEIIRGMGEAAEFNDIETMRKLIPLLEWVTEDHKLELFNGPLNIAAMKGHFETIELLLKEGADPNRLFAGSPAIVQSGYHGHIKCVQLMMEEGNGNIDVQDTNGFTTLAHAVEKYHDEIVPYLIECGATRSIKTFAAGYSPLHFAALHGHYELLELLLPMSRCLPEEMHDNYNKNTPLMVAINNKHVECVELLAETEPAMLTRRDGNERTVLHHAAMSSSYESMRYLIDECNIDVNLKGDDGRTALMISAAKGDLLACKILACPKITEEDMSTTDEDDEDQPKRRENPKFYGGECNVDLTDANHECALLHAVKGAHKEVARFLVVEAGASLEIENRHCETVIEWVKKMKLSKMLKYLEKLPKNRELYVKQEIYIYKKRRKRKQRRERLRNKGGDSSEDFSETSSEEDEDDD